MSELSRDNRSQTPTRLQQVLCSHYGQRQGNCERDNIDRVVIFAATEHEIGARHSHESKRKTSDSNGSHQQARKSLAHRRMHIDTSVDTNP